MPNLQPNRYTLQSADGNVKVEYESSNFVGQRSLNLTQGPSPIGPIRHFAGSQVRVRNTEVGTLVTVTTRMTIDQGSTSFSLLLPAISLAGVSDKQSFATEAIVTTHSGPDSFPRTGVHETYQFVPMQGEASLLLSLLEPLSEILAGAANS